MSKKALLAAASDALARRTVRQAVEALEDAGEPIVRELVLGVVRTVAQIRPRGTTPEAERLSRQTLDRHIEDIEDGKWDDHIARLAEQDVS